MKAIKMMMFVTAATMMFASCSKDEIDLENNQLRYDGTVYNMVSSASTDADGSYVSFGSVGSEAMFFSLNGQFEEAAFNRTYNHTVAAEDVHFYIDFWSEMMGVNFSYDNNRGRFFGGMEGVPEGESIFSEDSCRIDYDNEGLTITLDGTLKNGKELAFKVFVPKDKIRMI